VRLWSERTSGRGDGHQIVGSALLRFTACSVLALVVFGAGSVLLAHHIAYEEATRDAVDQTSSLARGVVAHLADDGLRAGEDSARDDMSTVLSPYVGDGPAKHLTLVAATGRVLWSDGSAVPLNRVHLTPWARGLLTDRGSGVGTPLAADSDAGSAELADVYVGVTDATGRPLLVVATMPVPVHVAQWHLVKELIPLALAGMVAFALASGWLAVSLARRVERGLRRQSVLERKAFLASDVERRRLARDLHDGVIQELSAASYALPLVADGLADEPGSLARRTLNVVGDILIRQLTALRTLMMDVYPSQLDEGGLVDGLEVLAHTARLSGLEVDLDAGTADAVGGDDATLVYRVVREGLNNVVRHAGASTVRVSVLKTADGLTVTVEDDGRGPDGRSTSHDDGGHLGVVLLRDALIERGGSLELRAGDQSGAVLEARLPAPNTGNLSTRRVIEVPAGH